MTPLISPAAHEKLRLIRAAHAARAAVSARLVVSMPRAAASTVLRITTEQLPAGVVGQDYAAQIAAEGGVAPYTFSLSSGALPDGLSLSDSGLISGVPEKAGTSAFTVKAVDVAGASAESELQIVIAESAGQKENARAEGSPSTMRITDSMIVRQCDAIAAKMTAEQELRVAAGRHWIGRTVAREPEASRATPTKAPIIAAIEKLVSGMVPTR